MLSVLRRAGKDEVAKELEDSASRISFGTVLIGYANRSVLDNPPISGMLQMASQPAATETVCMDVPVFAVVRPGAKILSVSEQNHGT